MAKRASLILSIHYWSDAATLSGGVWSASLPLVNLKDRQVQRVARSTNASAASTQFDVDLGALQPVRVLALVNHNISQIGTWRLRLSDSDPSFAAAIYDSGFVDVWPQVVPFGLANWGGFNWGQGLSESEAGVYGPYAVQVTAAELLVRYLRFEIADTGNAEGFVELGRLIVADAFQPAHDKRLGWQLSHVDPTRVVESRAGQRWFDLRPKRRRVAFELTGLSKSEAYAQIDLLDRLIGRGGEVLAVLDPDDRDNLFRQTIHGTKAELPPIEQIGADLYARRFVIEELI